MAFLEIPHEFASKTTDEIVAQAGSPLPLIPEGKYTAIISTSEMKDTSTGGKMLVAKFVITKGEHMNTELIERYNVVNANQTAVKIAYETLAKIAKAVGLKAIPKNSDAMHNKPLQIVVKTEKGTPFKDKVTGEERLGSDKSVIKGYEALPASEVQQSAQKKAKLPWEN